MSILEHDTIIKLSSVIKNKVNILTSSNIEPTFAVTNNTGILFETIITIFLFKTTKFIVCLS